MAAVDVSAKKRQKWGFPIDAMFFGIASTIGFGAVWRFPFLMYRSGGVVFLIPYVFFMVVLGLPLTYLELLIGQCGGVATHLVFHRMAPIVTGVGVAMTVCCAAVAVYYNSIVALTIRYVYDSFSVPWDSCKNYWNTPDCITVSGSQFEYRGGNMSVSSFNPSTAAREYYYRFVLESQNSLYPRYEPHQVSLGSPNPDLVLCLAIAWVVVAICFLAGVKSAGKIVYLMVILPLLFVAILFIRGVTLQGAKEGVKFYFTPNLQRLREFETWRSALIQVFYTFGFGLGILPTIGSYNRFRNCAIRAPILIFYFLLLGASFRFFSTVIQVFFKFPANFSDAVNITLVGIILPFLFGFCVFCWIGFAASVHNMQISEMAISGSEMAFVAMADAVTHAPWPSLWSFLWFATLLMLGLGSQLGMVNVVLTAVFDQFPKIRDFPIRIPFVGAICAVLFLPGILFLTKGSGHSVLYFVDNYLALVIMFLALIQVLSICYVHGFWRLAKDISLMAGIRYRGVFHCGLWCNPIWLIFFCIITPIGLALLVFNAIYYYYEPMGFETWVHIVFGWLLMWLGHLAIIFVFAIIMVGYCIVKRKGCLWLFSPTQEWPFINNEEPTVIPLRTGYIISMPQGEAPPPSYKTVVEESGPDNQKHLEDCVTHQSKIYPQLY